MKRFKQFAIVATAATYIQIYIGGLVRISGAGLGCPDWPTCFGRWFPPTDVSQLPPDIDPAQFNFVLAWIEYVNRLIGALVGLLIAITAIWALVRFIRYPRLWIPSGLAAVLVAYLGWQGGRMIEAQLDQTMISIHMGLAFIVASLMIYAALQAHYVHKGMTSSASDQTGSYRSWIVFLFAVSVIQVVLGTQVRTAIETVGERFLLLPQSAWLGQVGSINIIHTVLGIVTMLIAWQTGAKIIKRFSGGPLIIRQAAWTMILLATLQTLFGAILALAGVPDLLRLYHLLLSALFIGSLIMVFTAIQNEGRPA